MKPSVVWTTEFDRIAVLKLHEDWQWETLEVVSQDVAAFVRKSDQPAYVLIDCRRAHHIPGGDFITHLHHLLNGFPPQLSLVIFITDNMLMKRLLTIFQNTFEGLPAQKLRVVATLDDAHHLIENHPLAFVDTTD